VYYKVVSENSRFISLRVEVSLFVLSPKFEGLNKVDVGNWANKMQQLCDNIYNKLFFFCIVAFQ
jgi:septin family protein